MSLLNSTRYTGIQVRLINTLSDHMKDASGLQTWTPGDDPYFLLLGLLCHFPYLCFDSILLYIVRTKLLVNAFHNKGKF